MIIQLDISRNLYVVDFDFHPGITAEIKKIEGAQYIPSLKTWNVPCSSLNQLQQFAEISRKFDVVDWRKKAIESEMPDLLVPHQLKLEPRNYQLKGIARGLVLKRCINADEPGLGKSEVLTAKIATPNGWVLMGDIKIDDSIFSKDGSVQKVEGIFPQGIIPTYRITMNDSTFVDCSLDHIWCVRDSNMRLRGKGWTTKTTSEIMTSGIVNKSNPMREASGRKPSFKWEIPMCDPVQFTTKEYVIPAYTMGALIGDGSLSCGKVQLSLPDAKNMIIAKINAELSTDMTISIAKYGDVTSYRIIKSFDKFHNGNPYTTEIRRLKIDLLSSAKFIPLEYMQGDVSQRMDLLRGLMDTDGSCIKNRTTFHTTSEQLTIDIRELVESLGGLAIIRPYDRTTEDKGIEYQVNIRTNFNPFFLDYKKDAWKPNKMFKCTRYIESIEFVGMQQQQCIRVSSPDHLYLTDDYIVTHNTMQSIATINIAQSFPCLVICPSSLKINWEREWSKFTDKKAMVLTDDMRDNWPYYFNQGLYQVFIVNYESLKKFFVLHETKSDSFSLKNVTFKDNINLFKSVIIDEIHRCKSSSTQQSNYCKGIAQGKDFVIGLTGTPIVNKPKDLVPQLSIIGKLEDFGGSISFQKQFCAGPTESSNLKVLSAMLYEHCMFRREKAKVLKELPEKVRQLVTVEISNREEYQFAENNLKEYLKQYKEATDKNIKNALRSAAMVRLTLLRQITARGKVKEVIDYVKDFQQSGKKVIIFCSLHIVVDQLKHAFPSAVSVTGRENQEQKQRAVDSFQNNLKTNIIICSIKAAGVGLTLTASSDVLFVEFPWTDADCCQCEDRAHRMGQKDSVTGRYFSGRNTIDERVYQIIQTKKGIANAVMGGSDEISESTLDLIANMFN